MCARTPPHTHTNTHAHTHTHCREWYTDSSNNAFHTVSSLQRWQEMLQHVNYNFTRDQLHLQLPVWPTIQSKDEIQQIGILHTPYHPCWGVQLMNKKQIICTDTASTSLTQACFSLFFASPIVNCVQHLQIYNLNTPNLSTYPFVNFALHFQTQC